MQDTMYSIIRFLKGFFSKNGHQKNSNVSNVNAIGSRVKITQILNTEGNSIKEDEKIVNLKYPVASGLQKELEEKGFTIRWIKRKDVESYRLNGHTIVYEESDTDKKRYKFVCKERRLQDDLILVKKAKDESSKG